MDEKQNYLIFLYSPDNDGPIDLSIFDTINIYNKKYSILNDSLKISNQNFLFFKNKTSKLDNIDNIIDTLINSLKESKLYTESQIYDDDDVLKGYVDILDIKKIYQIKTHYNKTKEKEFEKNMDDIYENALKIKKYDEVYKNYFKEFSRKNGDNSSFNDYKKYFFMKYKKDIKRKPLEFNNAAIYKTKQLIFNDITKQKEYINNKIKELQSDAYIKKNNIKLNAKTTSAFILYIHLDVSTNIKKSNLKQKVLRVNTYETDKRCERKIETGNMLTYFFNIPKDVKLISDSMKRFLNI